MNETNDTKKRIKEASAILFKQYGIRSVSMDEIAKEVGISKKTVYQIYKDKNSLVNDILETSMNEEKSKLHQRKLGAENAIEEGLNNIYQVSELFNSLNPNVLYDLKKYHSKIYRRFQDLVNTFIFNKIKEFLQWGIDDGLFREDINVNILAQVRLETLLLTFNSEFQTKTNSTIAEINAEFSYHFLYGIATKKGYSIIEKLKNKKTNNKNQN